MHKVSVITLHDVANYGSCLQAYATQETFKKLGWECEIVDYRRPKTDTAGRIRSLLVRRGFSNNGILFRLGTSAVVLRLFSRRYARDNFVFDRFRRKWLRLTHSYSSEDELEREPPCADVYCTGSDQVWNSVWNEGFEAPLYLIWAPQDKPRISFAASIGREQLDEWEKPLMFDALKKYKAISMREISGVRLLKDLGIKNVELVLDPTLMLTRSDWEKIATLPTLPDGGYILSYQLNRNDDVVRYTQKLGRHLGLPVVKICYRKNQRQSGAINLVAPEVTDFLGLFLKASYVVTDSFHATAFSLNLEKPFVSIAPNCFSTRIESILELTGTEDRLLSNYSDLNLINRNIDFSFVAHSLGETRKATLDFLYRALPSFDSPAEAILQDSVEVAAGKIDASC